MIDKKQEIEIIQKVQLGDRNALAQLYKIYGPLLLSIVRKINRAQSEDILQDVFVQIWKSANQFDMRKGSVFQWISRIARNKAIDSVRLSSHVNEVLAEDYESQVAIALGNVSVVDTPVKSLENKTDKQLVTTVLQKLSPEKQEALNLCYFEGLSQSDAAMKINIPLGTMKTRVRMALAEFTKLMAEEGYV